MSFSGMNTGLDKIWDYFISSPKPNGVITFSQKVFDRIHFILAGNDDIHKSLNEFEIRRDPTMDYGVGCL